MAINPGTPVSATEAILSSAELLLIMSVNPGFSGQKFIPESVEQSQQWQKRLIDKYHLKTQIQIDGGINAETLPITYKAGSTQFCRPVVPCSTIRQGSPVAQKPCAIAFK